MTETLVIGGTGTMGSRVVRRLLERPDAHVTVLTRNAGSPAAVALADDAGGRLRFVEGNIDDADSLRAAMATASRVFCNTDFFSTASALGEYRQGLAILEVARAAGVDRFVWSSLDSAITLTDGRIACPHYDAKAAVAAHIDLMRSEEFMRKDTDGWYSGHVSILTTSPYFENFPERVVPQPGTLPDGREGVTFHIPLGTGRYPMVGLDDIAWIADHMFEHWQSWGASDLAISGDSLTGDEIAATFEAVTGTPSAYASIPLDVLENSIPGIGHDFAGMFRFFQHYDVVGRQRDMALLRRLHPGLMTFADWLRRTGWDGSARPA